MDEKEYQEFIKKSDEEIARLMEKIIGQLQEMALLLMILSENFPQN